MELSGATIGVEPISVQAQRGLGEFEALIAADLDCGAERKQTLKKNEYGQKHCPEDEWLRPVAPSDNNRGVLGPIRFDRADFGSGTSRHLEINYSLSSDLFELGWWTLRGQLSLCRGVAEKSVLPAANGGILSGHCSGHPPDSRWHFRQISAGQKNLTSLRGKASTAV